MTSINLVETEKYEIKDPIVVIGFPDVGLVGSIATSYIVEQLKLKDIGYIESDEFPPVVIVHESRPKNTVRIYGGKNIIVLISEIPLPLSIIYEISETLTKWIISKHAKMALIIGGMPHPQRLEIESPQVYGVGTTENMDKILNENKIKLFEEGIIAGVHGVLLKKCADEKIPAAYLLSESHYNLPDPGAAASSLIALNNIAGLNVDVKTLIEKGEEIRVNAKNLMKKTHEAMNEIHNSQDNEIPIMYR